MSKKTQLHQSGLRMMATCGEQYRLAYIERIRRPPGVAIAVGSATHTAVADNLRQLKESAIPLPAEQIKDSASDAFEKQVEHGLTLQPDEELIGEKTVTGEAKDKAVRLSLLHADEVAPGLAEDGLVGVEYDFQIDVEGFDFEIVGTVDAETTPEIRDSKTAKKSPAKDEAEKSIQLTMYWAQRYYATGEDKKVGLDYLVDLKRGPKHAPVDSDRTAEDAKVLLNQVANWDRHVKMGAFYHAAGSGHWACDPRYCGYYGKECKYTRLRPVSVAVPDQNVV